MLSLWQLGPLLWYGFHPWPGDLPQAAAAAGKKKKKEVGKTIKKYKERIITKIRMVLKAYERHWQTQGLQEY